MKSKIDVDDGQKLPIDLTDPGPLSGGGFSTTTASAIPPLPLSPWHMAQLAANRVLPCAGVPLPCGSPLPSGMTVRSHGARSASEIGCPRFGPSAVAGAAQTKRATSAEMILSVHIGHSTVGINRPARNRVVVMARKLRPAGRRLRLSAQRNELGPRGLNVPAFIPGAALQD